MSFIAAACDERRITQNGMMMIHPPFNDGDDTLTATDIELLSKMRDTMARAYAKVVRGGRKVVDQLLSRDSWLTAREAYELGLVTSII